ncbi:hypothetical protein ACIBFB_00155 [Nocardiopsis sp. NPDC050513]|uniref:hypothetical protein n=1 Tax=Nocardiopsis sp. NPDC050513 TaxID=3364338 RepID=UPI00378B58AD
MDLFGDDPTERPLTYPGRIPDTSGVFLGDAYVPLRPRRGRSAEAWYAEFAGEPATLAGVLSRLRRADLADRHPVVAVGSNAAPGQMRRKFLARRVRPVVPMTLADVLGIAPGVSAHVNRWGYVPAAPVEAPGPTGRLFVLWLDDAERDALDATEPNYRRRLLPEDRHPVTLASGVRLPPCSVYVSRHGCLVDGEGRPRRLTDQPTLIRALLAESAGLRRLCGTTPESFVDRVRDPSVRDAVRRLLRAEGRVAAQPGLAR